MALGDDQIRCRRQLQPAAESMALQNCDQGDCEAGKTVESAMAGAGPAAPHFDWRQIAPCGDVAAGTKSLALADQ